jgi:hypothetical protein
LTIALDRNVAADCLGEAAEDSLSLWPSSLYGILATKAALSRKVWDRCFRQIERSLGHLGKRFDSLPPSSLSQLFREGAQALDNRELAALLWALLKRHEPMSERIAGRLGAELEVVAVRRSVASTDAKALSDDAIDPVDDSVGIAPCFSPKQTAHACEGHARAALKH